MKIVIKKRITSRLTADRAFSGVNTPKRIINTPPKNIEAQGGILVIPRVAIKEYVTSITTKDK
ncbi:hypothetical protein HS5_18490 [Acidianus sp. HS-5]|nr:hypothetical protein HS5_18490 [Acidianus sp. HS-5]